MPQYSVSSDDVQAAGGKIDGLSTQIEELIGQMMTTASSVEWTGQAHGAFENAMRDWQGAANQIRDAAQQMGVATKQAGTNYGETETQNMGMFR